jgi:hypothetical protein
MTKELWIALLQFVSGVVILGGQVLPLPPEVQPWIAFAVGVINLALSAFFGVQGFRARAAAKAAK